MTNSKGPIAESDGSGRPRARAIAAFLLSPDFLVGVPLGLAVGVLPATIPALVANGFAFMATLAAISAGIAALVLTPMALLSSVLNPAFKSVLAKTPGGVAGAFVPFGQVALVAAGACVTSLIVAILTPLAAGTFPVVVWLCAGIPIALFLWAVIGCVQVTAWMIDMVRKAHRAEVLVDQIGSARATKAARAG